MTKTKAEETYLLSDANLLPLTFAEVRDCPALRCAAVNGVCFAPCAWGQGKRVCRTGGGCWQKQGHRFARLLDVGAPADTPTHQPTRQGCTPYGGTKKTYKLVEVLGVARRKHAGAWRRVDGGGALHHQALPALCPAAPVSVASRDVLV